MSVITLHFLLDKLNSSGSNRLSLTLNDKTEDYIADLIQSIKDNYSLQDIEVLEVVKEIHKAPNKTTLEAMENIEKGNYEYTSLEAMEEEWRIIEEMNERRVKHLK